MFQRTTEKKKGVKIDKYLEGTEKAVENEDDAENNYNCSPLKDP